MVNIPIKVEIGQKIREWTVVRRDLEKKKGQNFICRCKCGKELSKPIGDLIRTGPNECKSCACKRRNFRDLGSTAICMLGRKIGKWSVLERDTSGKIPIHWKCKCECGIISIISGAELRRGKSTKCKSCSIREKSTKHGFATRGRVFSEYNSWAQMKNRCLNTKDKRYSEWGGRGISVYQPWIDSFERFFKYIGYKPKKNMSLDRIDNDGNYEPGNVRWATPKQQANNRSNNKKTPPDLISTTT